MSKKFCNFCLPFPKNRGIIAHASSCNHCQTLLQNASIRKIAIKQKLDKIPETIHTLERILDKVLLSKMLPKSHLVWSEINEEENIR